MLHEIIYRRMCLGSYESFCSSAGHEVATVEERRLSGAEDEIVLAQALSENRAFLTRDMHFSNIRIHRATISGSLS
jgi:predicted nuclease of predicted toxin-antitoxin system